MTDHENPLHGIPAILGRPPAAPLKAVMCAATGGHLAQLVRMADDGVPLSDDTLWISFDSPQSRALLGDRRCLLVPYVAPRDLRSATRAARLTFAEIGRERFDIGVSTGAAVAVGVFAALAVRRIPLLYVESVSRTRGPSLTGRIIAASRLATLRTQHRNWAEGRWQFDGSVLNSYRAEPRPGKVATDRVFVTLGTIRPYRFDAAVDAVKRAGGSTDHTTWQLGTTTRTDLPGAVHTMVPADRFADLAAQADVVVTHSGVGTILQLLEMGICPVVLVRRAVRGEHVDDHQAQIAQLLRDGGLAVVAEVDDLRAEHLALAARTIITMGPRERASH